MVIPSGPGLLLGADLFIVFKGSVWVKDCKGQVAGGMCIWV